MVGMAEAIVYHLAKKPISPGKYLATAMIISLVVAVPIFIAGYFLMPLFLAAQPQNIVEAARKYLLIIFFFPLAIIPTQSLRGQNKISAWNILRLTSTIVWVVALISAFVMNKKTSTWITAEYLLLYMIFAVIILVVTVKMSTDFFPPSVRIGKQMLKYGVWSSAGYIPQQLNLRLDQMLLASILPASMLGLYVVAVSWSAAIAPVVSAIGSILFPYIANSSSTIEQKTKLALGCRLGFTISISMSILLMGATPIAIPLLFGNDYRTAIPVAFILVIAGGVAGFNGIAEECARGLGYPKIALIGEICGLVVTVISLLFLIRPLGIIGAGIASLLGYTFTAAGLLIQLSRFSDNKIGNLLIPHSDDFAVLRMRVDAVLVNYRKGNAK